VTWSIPIPYQSRDQTITEAISANVERALDGEEREVAFQILFDPPPGLKTVGDLLNHIEKLGAEGRRRLLDKARAEAGLKSTGAVDAHEAFEQNTAALPPSPGPRPQSCAAEGCVAYPMNELGVPVPVADRTWWCDQHRHLAGENDHLPPEPRYELDLRTMSERPTAAEQERLLKEEEERVAKVAERTRIKREEGERLAEL
jgi:hypothetical protein